MKNKFRSTLVFILGTMLLFSTGFAQKGQTSSAYGVKVRQNNLGASFGLWHGIAFSIYGERTFKELPEFNGIIGLGGEIGYASDSDEWKGYGYKYGWKYTYIPIFAFISFHYLLSDPKIDPYVRAGLGFVYVSSKAYGTFLYDWDETSSYVGIDGQVGIRYALSPNLWVRASAGVPWILSAGIDFRIE